MNAMLKLHAIRAEDREMLRSGWFGFVGVGCLIAALGLIGFVFVGLATYVSVLFIGWAFVIGGVAEVVHAIIRKGWSGFLLDFISAIITALAGILILAHPFAGASVLTIVVGVMFLIGGIFRIAAGVALNSPYAGWFVFYGAVSALLGCMILAEWPNSLVWVIGTLVSIDLLMNGMRLIAFGLAVRHLPKAGEVESTPSPAPAVPQG
jgi:uncharacterized membrane protein HdeD (DUF308 family)